MMGKSVDLALYVQVVVESVAVKVAKLRGIPLQGGVLKRYNNIGFHKKSSLEGHKALEMLDKKYYVFVVNIFAYKHYLALFIYLIKMRVEIAKIRLIPPFGRL